MRGMNRLGRLERLEERVHFDAAGFDADAAAAEADVRVLLVADDLLQAEDLAQAAQADVLTVVYDSDASPEAILDQVRQALNGRTADALALATHGAPGELQLADGIHVTAGTLAAEHGAFWQDLGQMLTPQARIDLLACGLGDSPAGQALLAALETWSGHEVAASVDATGNGPDADWILETDGIDAATAWFEPVALSQVAGQLAPGDPTDLWLTDLTPDDLQNSLATLAAGSAAGDRFGASIDIDYAAGRMVIGAPGVAAGEGRAYIYHWNGTAWSPVATLSDDVAAAGERFGEAVAIEGDRLVVGAPNDAGDVGRIGTINLFTWDGAAWIFDRQLSNTAAAGVATDFGAAVDLDGNLIVIGAPLSNVDGAGSGSVTFYHEAVPGFWVATTELVADTTGVGDHYGTDVAIDSGRAIIGAPGAAGGAGRAYVFTLSSTADILPEAILSASDAQAGAGFGSSLDLESGALTLAIGAPQHAGTGAAYIFARSGTSWSQTAAVTAADAVAGARFGSDVAILQDTLGVGAAGAGKAYLFRNDGGWVQTGVVAAAGLGETVAVRPGTLYAGAPDTGAGAVYAADAVAALPEDAVGGTAVGSLRGVDPQGDSLSFSLVGGATDRFEIVGTTLRLRSGVSLDYETQTSHSVVVRATDPGGNFRDETITIRVLDRTEPVLPPEPEPEPPTLPPSDPVGGESGGEGAADGEGETGETGTEAIITPAAPAAGVAAENLSPVEGLVAAALLPEQRDVVRALEEELREELTGEDLVSALLLTDLAFTERVLFDPDQPAEILAAFDTILGAYSASGDELAAYLQSAFRSVAESAIVHRDASRILILAQQQIASDPPAPAAEALQELSREVEMSQAEVRQATEELRRSILGAVETGEAEFDRAFEDVIMAALLRLSETNDDLLQAGKRLERVMLSLARLRQENPEALTPEAVEQIVKQSDEEVREEIAAIRNRWDRASEDVFAAFVRRLVTERAAAAPR